jgi:hypothetical protein
METMVLFPAISCSRCWEGLKSPESVMGGKIVAVPSEYVKVSTAKSSIRGGMAGGVQGGRGTVEVSFSISISPYEADPAEGISGPGGGWGMGIVSLFRTSVAVS